MRYLLPVLLLLFGTFAIELLCAQSVPRLPTRNVRDYGAKGDGFADDTNAFLRALNEARGNPDGAKAPLNVYVPAGRYLLRDTLILWKATRLVGDWRNPPTLVLAPNTKGFGDWERPRPFLVTANGYRLREDSRDWHTRSNEVGGSTNNTFGVYLMDLNVEIGEGNAGAWGVYWLVAQQTAMRNVRINAGGAQGCIRSFFWGGGGVIANVTCEGGDYGWQVRETSQFLMRSCVFTGQRKASIAIADAWMFTFLDVQFRDTAPFQADGGMVALLECSFEKVQGATVLDMRNGTFLLENVRVDDPSQLPADLRNAMTTMGSVPIWASRSVVLNGKNVDARRPPKALNSRAAPYEIRSYPRMSNGRVNIRDLGAMGDGTTDDTRVIRKALAENKEIFFPIGNYKVTGGLKIRAGQRLFGELGARIYLSEGSPGYEEGSRKPFIQVLPHETDGVILLGMTFENRAAGGICCEWRGHPDSTVVDTSFLSWGTDSTINWWFAEGGGWIENAWIPGGSGAGMIVNSNQPLWLYAVGPEHYRGPALSIDNGSHITSLNLQMEGSARPVIIQNAKNIRLVGCLAGNWGGEAPQMIDVIGGEQISLWNLSICNSAAVVRGPHQGDLAGAPSSGNQFSRLQGWILE